MPCAGLNGREGADVSVLGVVVRVLPQNVEAVAAHLAALPGVEVGAHRHDGRLPAVIVDEGRHSAVETLHALARRTDILNLSLIYEHRENDCEDDRDGVSFQAWRGAAATRNNSGEA